MQRLIAIINFCPSSFFSALCWGPQPWFSSRSCRCHVIHFLFSWLFSHLEGKTNYLNNCALTIIIFFYCVRLLLLFYSWCRLHFWLKSRHIATPFDWRLLLCCKHRACIAIQSWSPLVKRGADNNGLRRWFLELKNRVKNKAISAAHHTFTHVLSLSLSIYHPSFN